MKKKLLMMFCATLAYAASISCSNGANDNGANDNGANDNDANNIRPLKVDFCRGVALAKYFASNDQNGTSRLIFKDNVRAFVEAKAYGIIPHLARLGSAKVYTNDPDTMKKGCITKIENANFVKMIFEGAPKRNCDIDPQEWLNGNEGTYANVRAMAVLLRLDLKENTVTNPVTIKFCEANVSDANDAGDIFKDEANGGIGTEAAPGNDTADGFKKRVLKILFETTWRCYESSNPNSPCLTIDDSSVVRFIDICNKLQAALQKVDERFDLIRVCFLKFFAIVDGLMDICKSLEGCKANLTDDSVKTAIDAFIDSCKKLVGNDIENYYTGDRKDNVTVENMLGIDPQNPVLLALYMEIQSKLDKLINSVNNSTVIDKNDQDVKKTMDVLGNMNDGIRKIIYDSAVNNVPFGGEKKICKIVVTDKMFGDQGSFYKALGAFSDIVKPNGVRIALKENTPTIASQSTSIWTPLAQPSSQSAPIWTPLARPSSTPAQASPSTPARPSSTPAGTTSPSARPSSPSTPTGPSSTSTGTTSPSARTTSPSARTSSPSARTSSPSAPIWTPLQSPSTRTSSPSTSTPKELIPVLEPLEEQERTKSVEPTISASALLVATPAPVSTPVAVQTQAPVSTQTQPSMPSASRPITAPVTAPANFSPSSSPSKHRSMQSSGYPRRRTLRNRRRMLRNRKRKTRKTRRARRTRRAVRVARARR